MNKEKISNIAARLKLASVSVITDTADAMIRSGKDVIVFSIGRPDFDTPAHIKEAAKAALDKGQVHYAPNRGTMPMREAVTAYLKAQHGLDYDPRQEVMVTAGAQHAIMMCMHALLNPGDDVLVPSPGFLLYYSTPPTLGATVTPYILAEPDYRWQGAPAIAKSKILVLNSPNNPTGSVFTQQEMESIARFAIENDLMVLSDEAYDRFIFGNARHISIASLPDMKERTVVIGSLSKTFSMTGWRLGYAAAPPELITALAKLMPNYMLNVNSFAQAGGVAALTGPQECVSAMHAEFDKRRKAILAELEGAPKVNLSAPEGAFYLFLEHRATGLDSVTFCQRLLEEAHVACVPGGDFGPTGEWHTRISYAVSVEKCVEGVRRIRKFLERL